MEQKTSKISYAAPTARMLTVNPSRCIAASNTLNDMSYNSIIEDDFE